MNQLKSNLGRAHQVATSMGHATDVMRQSGLKQVQQANRTSVKVNQDAKQSSDKVKHLMMQLGKSFGRDVAHIRSVAQEFERMDHEVGNGLDFSGTAPRIGK
ncbi:TIGR04197 family type VII secretion effector [Listeria booriae]|uniref:TIGR04197 family type VII secretion effector n=1 Tax=Listeria booriae TaxID=1552123 RepID=UPI00162399E0|nr:TIGR04197 family type VII secretion effector [Listeria booriae]MBC2303803.1 TIGR04197 family type VII secretion effector [Listeria booriae]